MESKQSLPALLEDMGVDYAPQEDGTCVVVLRGVNKLKTTVALRMTQDTLRVEAFVCRAVEENHLELYTHLLRTQRRMCGVSWTLDGHGDIYLVGHVPLPLTADGLERILGQVLDSADGQFNHLVREGFASSIAKETQWREQRGESLAHLVHLQRERSQDGTLEV